MFRSLVVSVVMGLLVGCSDIKPGEEKATIVSFDSSYSICGGSWIVQGEKKQMRVLELPDGYRQANTGVLIKYEPDPLRSGDSFAACNFVNLTSIRRR